MKEVFFATDKEYIPHLTTAINSLLQNNQNLHINVISQLQSKDGIWKILRELINRHDSEIEFHLPDKINFEDLKTPFHLKVSAYYRLLIPYIAKSDKVIYLDSDIIINSSLDDLFNTQFYNDNYIAAVEEPGFTRHFDLEMDNTSKYFNTGVMVINVKKWKETYLTSRVIDFVRRKPEVILFGDQCGLNAVINGQWNTISPKFNLTSAYAYQENDHLSCSYSLKERINSRRNPTIIHYTGSLKPWHFCNDHPFKQLYWKYRNQTKYKTHFSDDFSLKKMVKCIFYKLLGKKQF